jgi:hypothetical protein
VVAKQHRGRDTLGNLAYACLRCTSIKGQTSPASIPEQSV